jgi:hypothetical protein
MEVSGQPHAAASLILGIHWMEGWVGPGAILDAMVKKKSLPLPEIEPRSSSL